MIREATKEDIPEILRLIQLLAEYEKEPDAVKTTAEDLLRDGFSDKPYFNCLMAEHEGVVRGFALYFYNWSTWEGRPSLYLEDLFVEPEARGSGLGLELLKTLAGIAVEKNCKRFEWSVLDWNQLARDFYHKLGAKHMEGWLPYRMEGEALKRLAEKG
ncbi:MAG: GNAT family N-acetyltransferase [Bdellovibrionales bacterium]|nr:GNAT family N-acetyltransferase [Bdellovibrionales bacterium]